MFGSWTSAMWAVSMTTLFAASGAFAYGTQDDALSLVISLLPFVAFATYALASFMRLEAKQRREEILRHRMRRETSSLRLSRSVYDRLDNATLRRLLSSRDFDSNDYEWLLQLEQFNEKKNHGASLQDIARLPHVTFTREMLENSSEERKQCAICLSDFEVGDQARLLQCFHRYHTACIDVWLQEKATCPECKFPAFG